MGGKEFCESGAYFDRGDTPSCDAYSSNDSPCCQWNQGRSRCDSAVGTSPCASSANVPRLGEAPGKNVGVTCAHGFETFADNAYVRRYPAVEGGLAANSLPLTFDWSFLAQLRHYGRDSNFYDHLFDEKDHSLAGITDPVLACAGCRDGYVATRLPSSKDLRFRTPL